MQPFAQQMAVDALCRQNLHLPTQFTVDFVAYGFDGCCQTGIGKAVQHTLHHDIAAEIPNGAVPSPLLGDVPQLPVSIPGTLCVCPDALYEGFYVAKLRRKK